MAALTASGELGFACDSSALAKAPPLTDGHHLPCCWSVIKWSSRFASVQRRARAPHGWTFRRRQKKG